MIPRILGRAVVPVAVVVVLLVVAVLLLLAIGDSPVAAASAFWQGTFGNVPNAGTTLTQSVPLVLVALGWIVSIRSGRLHVGYPGQIIAGGTVATSVGLVCGGLPAPLAVLITALAGILGGAAWAALTAWLWASRGVLEIVSSLLLNLVATQIAAWLVRGPLQSPHDPQPQTATFPASTLWPDVPFLTGQTLSFDVLLVPICVIGVSLMLSRTSLGFGFRVSGGNESAARWAGYDPVRSGVTAIVISGGFAGLAGAALLFAGAAPWMSDGFEAGIGFNGIAVALLARNSPAGAILAAILFSSLNIGATSLQAQLDVPASLAEVLQGAVVVLVLLAVAILYRRQLRSRPLIAESPTKTVRPPRAAAAEKGAS